MGRTIIAASVDWPRTVAPLEPDEFRARLVGARVTAIRRRGKYLLIELSGGDTLLVHRRMSGNLVFSRAGETVAYARVSLELDDGRRVVFSDPRKFGRLSLAATSDVPQTLGALGPEPLDDAFTASALAERLARQGRAIKAVLLEQSIVAGLGNIYADEALFRAGIHPTRPARGLLPGEIMALRDGIRHVLRTGIEHGGTTFGRHRDVFNEAGTNVEHLLVYRRTGQPCLRCGTPIQRMVVAQRGTHFCPRCQPPRSDS